MQRRAFLGAASASAVVAGAVTSAGRAGASVARPAGWQSAGHSLNVKEAAFGIPAAVGDGVTDDTAAVQGHLNLAGLFGGGTVIFPAGRYKTTSEIVQAGRIEAVSETSAYTAPGQVNSTDALPVIQANHPGRAWTLSGQFSRLHGLCFAGSDPAPDVISVYLAETCNNTVVEECFFFRTGKAALGVRGGENHILRNSITCGHGGMTRGPDARYGLWLQATADSLVHGNDIAAPGYGLFCSDGAGCIISNNFVYNSWINLFVQGARMCQFTDNRVDEADNEGIVLDWHSNGNQFTGLVHNCGARVAQPNDRRVGLRIGSGTHNRFDLIFDNWDHNVQQEGGALDFRSPMVHGVLIRPFGPNSATRPVPQFNRVDATYRNLRSTPILNEGDPTNVLVSVGAGT